MGNEISKSAIIGDQVTLGNYNTIGDNVVLQGKITLGDCNQIHNNTRIIAGSVPIDIGDWNVFHNNMFISGEAGICIGHNCWFGQNTVLDGTGHLFIGHGVRIGMYSQIWTHVSSGEQIEGCTLLASRPTFIANEVWLVGSCTVGSGLTLGYRSICMTGSVITKNTLAEKVYGGSPARQLEKLSFYKTIFPEEKKSLIDTWITEYQIKNAEKRLSVCITKDISTIEDLISQEKLLFSLEDSKFGLNNKTTWFNLSDKTYTKKLTNLERSFYKFIFGNKARFLPKEE